jgi:hypothetical protein
MKFGDYPKINSFASVAGFVAYLAAIGLDLPCDEILRSGPAAPLAQPIVVCGRRLANRFAVNPMEGWDGMADGRPSDNTRRRWQRFGRSGAKLIWGGEAVAVRQDGRANPRQLCMTA